jgi:hypothetical protein
MFFLYFKIWSTSSCLCILVFYYSSAVQQAYLLSSKNAVLLPTFSAWSQCSFHMACVCILYLIYFESNSNLTPLGKLSPTTQNDRALFCIWLPSTFNLLPIADAVLCSSHYFWTHEEISYLWLPVPSVLASCAWVLTNRNVSTYVTLLARIVTSLGSFSNFGLFCPYSLKEELQHGRVERWKPPG